METDISQQRLRDQLGKAARRHLAQGGDAAFEELSSSLTHLLDGHWAEADLRPPHEFDGLGHARITSRSTDDLELIGFMYVLATQESEWFSATVALIPGTPKVESYRLRYGLHDAPPFGTEPSRADFEHGLEAVSGFAWAHEFRG